MDVINNINFALGQCDIVDMIDETQRFLIHMTIVHVLGFLVDGKAISFNREFAKSFFITAISIMLYYVLFKKMILSQLDKKSHKCRTIYI